MNMMPKSRDVEMKTEDDTFMALFRSPYEVVNAHLRREINGSQDARTKRSKIIKSHNWTFKEMKAEHRIRLDLYKKETGKKFVGVPNWVVYR